MNTTEMKQARLNAIQDEVGQLHPLLKLLLPKLPRVQHVEYTHGPTEMGADFTFSRLEDVLQQTEYVGVIAKVGKIVQDYDDVERQLKECEIERLFANGRKKIYLTEVWVIATGSVTKGAQEKIHANYKTRKILFIDGDRLSALIDQYLPNYWTDVSLEIGDYLHGVSVANDRLDKSLSLISNQHERFYVQQDIFECEDFDPKKPRPPRRVDLHEQVALNSVVLIEGGMGSGKSKLLRTLVDHYSTPHQFLKSELLPVWVSFRDLLDKYELDPLKAVNALVPLEVREAKPTKARYLLLLDGADEKDLPADKLADAVVQIAEAIDSAGLKAVITSRWCDAYERNPSLKHSAKRLELHPLSTNRLIEFIRKLCRDIDLKSRLIEDLRKSAIFKELPRSPIAAILLAQLLNENAQELPSNLTELYTKYTELSLGRWDIEKGLQTLKEFEALSSIVTTLAEHFLLNQIEGLAIDEARTFFDSYLQKRNLGLRPDELFHKLTSRCDIISVDPDRRVFRFKHKTFLEFFYARAHLKKPMLVNHRVWHPYWATTFYFYVGLQKDCPELIEEILRVEPKTEADRWMRLINTPNYLLAGFSSPYEIVERALASAMRDAADLYTDVSEGHIKSPLAVFPKMHFLWLMQMMVRHGYGFDFFKRAVDTATLQLSDTADEPKKAAVATFFLSVIGRELGEKSCFDFLITNYQKELPLEIELAIRHETGDDRQRSHLLKKLFQRVGRALKANPSLQEFVTSLYERPLRSIISRQVASGK